MAKKLLGQYLMDDRMIDEKQLQRALEIQANSPASNMPLIGTVLVQMGALKEQDITSALEKQTNDRTEVRS